MAEVSTIVTAIKQYLQQTSEPSPQTWTAGNTLTFELGSFHQVWLLWHPGLKLPTSELWDRCPNHSAAKLLRFNTKKTDFNKWLTPWNWTLSRQMESKYANAFQENIGTCNCVFIPSSYKASLKKKKSSIFCSLESWWLSTLLQATFRCYRFVLFFVYVEVLTILHMDSASFKRQRAVEVKMTFSWNLRKLPHPEVVSAINWTITQSLPP